MIEVYYVMQNAMLVLSKQCSIFCTLYCHFNCIHAIGFASTLQVHSPMGYQLSQQQVIFLSKFSSHPITAFVKSVPASLRSDSGRHEALNLNRPVMILSSSTSVCFQLSMLHSTCILLQGSCSFLKGTDVHLLFMLVYESVYY